MKKRRLVAIVMSLIVGITQIPVFSAPVSADRADAATTPALSATKLTVRVGSKKTLKVKNTSYKVTFSISSGSTRIKLTSKKKKQVSIKGVKKGSAKVKAKVKLSSKKTKTLTCKVTVKDAIWICPTCGEKNDTNYCANCGTIKPTPTPSPGSTTATATPTPTATPTATPTGADALSSRMIWMQINGGYYVGLKMYANAAATDFYNRVASGTIGELSMEPTSDGDRVAYLTSPVAIYKSASRVLNIGDVYMYDQYTLKVAVTDHTSASYPTRIAKIYDSVYRSSVTDGVSHDSQSKSKIRFLLNFS